MEKRAYSPADRLLMNLDQAVRTLFGRPQVTERANPADSLPEVEMSEAQRDHAEHLEVPRRAKRHGPGGLDIVEVTDHPILSLLRRPNAWHRRSDRSLPATRRAASTHPCTPAWRLAR